MKNDTTKTEKQQQTRSVDVEQTSLEQGRKRRKKIGMLSLVSTIIVIAVVIAINYLADYLGDRYVLEIDMTSESEYEISDETVQLLQTLDEPIKITVLCDETDYENDEDLNRLPKVLKRYEQLSDGMVTVEYINAVTNPGIFEQYNDLGDLSTGDIIVESAKRYKAMDPHDLLEYTSSNSSSSSTTSDDSSSYYVTGLRAEQRLTSAILYVTANKVPKAAFISGHQEKTSSEMEEMTDLLTSGNYEITDLSLMQENEIPADVDLIVILEPMSDYTDDEINLIDDFMNDGGRMIVAYASNTPDLPNLTAYFEEWGIAYQDTMVYDTERCYAGYNAYIFPYLTTVEGITDNLDSNSYVIVPGSRAIDVLWTEDNWRGTQQLMTTSDTSYAKDLSKVSSGYEKAADDETGPFNIGVMSYQTTMHNLDSTHSYALFLNAGFLDDSTLGNDSFLNKEYFLSVLNFMSDDTEAVVIESKDLTSTTLAVPGSAKRVIYYILLIIPAACLAFGIVVWVRRRHL